MFSEILYTINTHHIGDKLRSIRPDMMDGVKHVYFLLRLHVFDEVGGSTQHSTASRSVSGGAQTKHSSTVETFVVAWDVFFRFLSFSGLETR